MAKSANPNRTATPSTQGSRPGSAPPKNSSTIVAIGSSAGGLKALQSLFGGLPNDLGACFVVISHLAPNHPSELVSILSRCTKMPVCQVQQRLPLEANHVYVIAPDRQLSVSDSHIATLPFDEPRGQRVPIDLFFRSLAEQHGDGFAVVLSGGGSDGSIGIRAVKEAGGVILVQDPNEAEYASMPRSAIATGCADVVQPIAKLAESLAELISSKRRLKDIAIGGDQPLRQIFAYLKTRTGHDFAHYKRPTMLRRLKRRMQINHIEFIEDYYAFLRGNVEEMQALFADLLISVTTFFRDPAAFDTLAAQVVAPLISKERPVPVRVWVSGCATGEEAYSITSPRCTPRISMSCSSRAA